MTGFFGGDLVTGLVTVRNIPARAGRVTTDLDAGSIGCDVGLPLTDPLTRVAVDIPNLLIPGRSFLAYEEDGIILAAGPIWSDDYDFDSGRYTLNAAGLLSYFDYRYVLPVLTGGQLPADVTSTWTTSLRTMAKRLVEQCQAWSPSLPIVFESDVAGSNVRTYPGSDMMRVRDALTNLSNVQGGPDIVFRPEWADSTHVQWRLVTGDPLLTQSGHRHTWVTTVPGSSVKGVSIQRDATVLSGWDYESGDAGLGAVAADSTLTTAGYPLFQTRTARPSVILQSTVQDYADAAVVVGRSHLQTWAFSARKDQTPKLGEYWPGDLAAIQVPKNPRVAEGVHNLRIMSFTVNVGDEFVDIKFAPERS